MKEPKELEVRLATAQDQTAFQAFRCSTGLVPEVEVEDFVCNEVLGRSLQHPADVRLLVGFEEGQLVACGTHAPELIADKGQIVVVEGRTQRMQVRQVTRLGVVAIALDRQGHRFGSGERLSDYFMRTLMFDALFFRRMELISGIARRENLRSLAFCHRNGLTLQTRHGPDHLRLTGRFRAKTH